MKPLQQAQASPFEIHRGIYIVGGPEITDGRDGCVYLLNFRELIVVDSGAGWSVDKIVKNIQRLGFNCLQSSRIILTHCHIDHIGGAPLFRNRFGSQLSIHELDAPPVERGDPQRTAALWYQTAFPPTPIDLKFHSPEEILTLGGEKLTCLHTPGHTPGSISAFLDRDGVRILFAQDLHGPLVEEFGSNLDDWDRSTQKLMELDADILCEGHFGIYKSKKEVKDYILSYRRHYGVE